MLLQNRFKLFLVFIIVLLVCSSCADSGLKSSKNSLYIPSPSIDVKWSAEDDNLYSKAYRNGIISNEGYYRCQKYLHGWMKYLDEETGLIRQYLYSKQNDWVIQNSAADNYPFMVLTAFFTDKDLYNGEMKDILFREKELTTRKWGLPDDYDLKRNRFINEEPDLLRMQFGSSEYIKDGLLPLTEWLGESPWKDRMIELLDSIWESAAYQTEVGLIPTENVELHGEMLQVLSRVFWMTGDDKYLDWAIRLGDYYLLGNHHPSRDLEELRLRDHGCEVVSGLCELYTTLHYTRVNKKNSYKEPLVNLLDDILEFGRNEDGLFFDIVNPQNGNVLRNYLTDTWGYTYNGFYDLYLVDGIERYRDEVVQVMKNVTSYINYRWEEDAADGYADTIESALNLYNREPIEEVADWMDSQIKVMWGKQKGNGVIDAVYADGNFARTTIMYNLWKSRGCYIDEWREDLVLGAHEYDGSLYLVISAQEEWSGRLIFDSMRHSSFMNMPLDWPRINQFPEWYTVHPDHSYQIMTDQVKVVKGLTLLEGLPISLKSGDLLRIKVSGINEK